MGMERHPIHNRRFTYRAFGFNRNEESQLALRSVGSTERRTCVYLLAMMNLSLSVLAKRPVVGVLVIASLMLFSPTAWAQQSPSSAQAAWTKIQQLVQNLETAVQSKNLGGIHEPSMKIRAPIKTLKQHSTVLSGDEAQKMTAALKQLDTSITDLHSASDAGNQKEAESALKEVETAFNQLKSLDPDTAFKGM